MLTVTSQMPKRELLVLEVGDRVFVDVKFVDVLLMLAVAHQEFASRDKDQRFIQGLWQTGLSACELGVTELAL